MAKVLSIFRSVPNIDSWLSMADRLGISRLAGVAFSLLGSFALMTAIWIWANVPWWGLILIGLGTAAALVFIIERILKAVAHARAIAGPEGIDRIKLADDCAQIAQGILGLLAEHHTPMALARAEDTEAASKAWLEGIKTAHMSDSNRISAVGKLIEKYGDRYSHKAWASIYASARVVTITPSEIWHMQHGVRSENDLQEMAMLLGKLEADLRYGKRDEGSANGTV